MTTTFVYSHGDHCDLDSHSGIKRDKDHDDQSESGKGNDETRQYLIR